MAKKVNTTMRLLVSPILFVILVLPSIHAHAQNGAYLRQTKSRVDFRELQNQPAKTIPRMLLSAFCRGEIKAYFPNSPETAMHYDDFLDHFGLTPSSNEREAENDASLPCLDASCLTPDPWVLGCFSVYMDADEQTVFDNRTSKYVKKITAVRLVYSAECNPANLDYNGPVFRMEDIQSLSDTYMVTNPQNTAASLNIYDYLELGLLSSTTYEVNGKLVDHPAKTNRQEQERSADQEGGYWEN